MYIRALCVYSSDLEKGMEYLKRAIVLDPDHSKSKALALNLKRFKEKEKAGIEIIWILNNIFFQNNFIEVFITSIRSIRYPK